MFSREKIQCRVPIQGHYYSELVGKYFNSLIFPECGTNDNLESNPPNIDGYNTQALCVICATKLDLNKSEGRVQQTKHGKCMNEELLVRNIDNNKLGNLICVF